MHQPPCRRRHRHDAFMLTCETTIPRPPRFPPFSLPQLATKHNTQLRRHVSLFFSAVSPRERLTATATSTSTSPSRHDRSTPRRKLTIACTHRLKEKQKLTRAAGSSHYDGDAPPQSRASPNPIKLASVIKSCPLMIKQIQIVRAQSTYPVARLDAIRAAAGGQAHRYDGQGLTHRFRTRFTFAAGYLIAHRHWTLLFFWKSLIFEGGSYH